MRGMLYIIVTLLLLFFFFGNDPNPKILLPLQDHVHIELLGCMSRVPDK